MYLPADFTMQTVFPIAYAKDVLFAIRMIEEKWRRFFPEINYFGLNKAVTNVVQTAPGTIDVESVAGETGTTAFDPIFGEVVDNAAIAGKWKQPHLSGDRRAVHPEQMTAPLKVHAQVRREAKKKELQKLGFDEVRDLLLTIPLSLLDKLALTVQHDDQFVWDNEMYVVKQFEPTGYWKNTNLRLYMVLNCAHYRPGS